MQLSINNAKYLAESLTSMNNGLFIIRSQNEKPSLLVVVFLFNPEKNLNFNETTLVGRVREYDWILPAYTLAANANDIAVCQIVVRETFTYLILLRCLLRIFDFVLISLADQYVEKLKVLFETYGKEIHTARWIKKPDGPPIVLMVIASARAEKEALFYVEMSKHAHIVRTYGLVDNPNKEVMLVQERAQHGNLLHLIKERKEPLNEFVLKEIFIQVADGMSFLAHNNIAHGDLACRNILVFKYDEQNPKEMLVKVTDFGLSRGSLIYQSTSTSAATTFNIIPYRYTAPEILQNPDVKEYYNEKSDMYSMGVLMWETYFPGGKRPWSHINDDNEVKRRVIRGERLERPPTCSEKMWSLIQTTMVQEPSDRPTFSALHRQLIELHIEIHTSQRLSPDIDKALREIRENAISIDLSNTYLSDEEIKVIAEALKTNQTVCRLNLSQNDISDEGAIAIAEMLQVNRTVNYLMLNNNRISSEGGRRLAKSLTINKTLVSLYLANNPLGDEGIQSICEALKTNKTLLTLWIQRTQMSIIGIKLVAEMLYLNSILKELAIGNNNIDDNSVMILAEALKRNTSLTWLHMYSATVTDKGAFALASAIADHRRKIDYFYLADDPSMSDKGREAIKEALRTNAAGRQNGRKFVSLENWN